MENRIIGPVLPDNFPENSHDEDTKNASIDSYGPQLPAHLIKKKHTEPALPEPGSLDDFDIIGPVLPGSANNNSNQQALDERAEILKFKFLLHVGYSYFTVS